MKQPKTLPIAEAAPLGIGFEDLLCCPFCLSNAVETVLNRSGNRYAVICKLCGAHGPTTIGKSAKERAEKSWNIRPDSVALKARTANAEPAQMNLNCTVPVALKPHTTNAGMVQHNDQAHA